MVFHWSLSYSKSLQVSWTLLSILPNLNNAVVSMVSISPDISKSSSYLINPLVTVPSAPITISITVTFIFYSFFFSYLVSWYLSYFLLSFNFTMWSVHNLADFLLVTISSSDRLAKIKVSVCILKSQRSVCVSFSGVDPELCTCHLFIWSNSSPLWITCFTQSRLVL